MKKYKCLMCGYIYDPAVGDTDNGVSAGTAFEDLPDDWTCPECGVGKDEFEAIEEQPVETYYHREMLLNEAKKREN